MICNRCSQSKDEAEFRLRSRKDKSKYLNRICKECENKARRNCPSVKNRKKSRQACQRHRNRNRAYFLIRYARDRAAEKGWSFDLSDHREEIQSRIDAGLCELTGIGFDLNGSRSFNSPSIDRIDPAAGYTYDNIRIICFAMNSALGNWGEEILHAVLTSWNDKREREGKGFSGINAEIFTEDNRQTSIDLI